jgi:hypothetical protein
MVMRIANALGIFYLCSSPIPPHRRLEGDGD